MKVPSRHGMHCPLLWTLPFDQVLPDKTQRPLVSCYHSFFSPCWQTKSAMSVNSAVFALNFSVRYPGFISDAYLSGIFGGIRLFHPFLLSFLLLSYIILPKSIVCHKKENHRVEHRNKPFKSVIRSDLTNHWACDSYPIGIHLDKLCCESPIKLHKGLYPSLCFCPENLTLIQTEHSFY